jgi:hypothetical protein
VNTISFVSANEVARDVGRRRCVETLRPIGNKGALSVEHEPADHDPADTLREMRERLQAWIA